MSVSTKKVDQRRTKGSSNTVLEYQRSRLDSQISPKTPISKRINDDFYLVSKSNKLKENSSVS